MCWWLDLVYNSYLNVLFSELSTIPLNWKNIRFWSDFFFKILLLDSLFCVFAEDKSSSNPNVCNIYQKMTQPLTWFMVIAKTIPDDFPGLSAASVHFPHHNPRGKRGPLCRDIRTLSESACCFDLVSGHISLFKSLGRKFQHSKLSWINKGERFLSKKFLNPEGAEKARRAGRNILTSCFRWD